MYVPPLWLNTNAFSRARNEVYGEKLVAINVNYSTKNETESKVIIETAAKKLDLECKNQQQKNSRTENSCFFNFNLR